MDHRTDEHPDDHEISQHRDDGEQENAHSLPGMEHSDPYEGRPAGWSSVHWASVNRLEDEAVSEQAINPIPEPVSVLHERVEPEKDLFGNPPPDSKSDWSHRKGEPRLLALCWMIYLMGATVLMFSSMSAAVSISHDITRPAAQKMMLSVIVGACVLWPMVRLSQTLTHSKRGVHFYLRDVVVLFIPTQAIIWPQVFPILADWPIDVVSALSLMLLAWMVLLSGILTLGSLSIKRNHGHWLARMSWMIVVMLAVCIGPVYVGLSLVDSSTQIHEPRISWMLSPLSGIFELTRDRGELGMSSRVFFEHWKMIVAVFCTGIAMLMFAKAGEVASTRG